MVCSHSGRRTTVSGIEGWSWAGEVGEMEEGNGKQTHLGAWCRDCGGGEREETLRDEKMERKPG